MVNTATYMKILSRFVVQGNLPRVLEKLAEIEELSLGQGIPWMDMVNYPCKESLACLASRLGHVSILKVLHLKHAPAPYFEIENMDGKRPIHEAVEHNHIDCVQYLVDNIGVCVNSLNHAHWTPLMFACTNSSVEMVKYLLNHEADLHFHNIDGFNACHLACQKGNLEIVKLVFRADLVAGTICRNEKSPLHTAAVHGHTAVVQFLLNECHVDGEIFDTSGEMPIIETADHQELAPLLAGH